MLEVVVELTGLGPRRQRELGDERQRDARDEDAEGDHGEAQPFCAALAAGDRARYSSAIGKIFLQMKFNIEYSNFYVR